MAYVLFLAPRYVSLVVLSRAEHQPEQLDDITLRATLASIALVGVAALVALVLARPVLGLVGSAYQDEAVGLLQLMCLAAVPHCVVVMVAAWARGRQRVVLAVLVSIAEYVAMIGFALLFVGRMGVMGFGWAWLAGETLAAVVLAGVALAMVMGTDADGITVMSVVVRQFFLGGLIGFMGGTFGAQLLERRSLKELKSGQAVICLAVLLVLLGGTTLLGGSGLLAAYIGGLVIGNHDQVERQELEDGHEVFTKLAELLLFLCMGLVVAPEDVLRMLPWIVLLFVAMQIVRLLTVPPLLAGSCSGAEKLFVSFCGLRGAVPIALAIQAAAQAKGPEAWGHYMPPLALGVVLLGLLVQGFSLVPLAQRLGLTSADAA